MFNKLFPAYVKTAVVVEDMKQSLRKIERGDADSSGSTLRTLGIVVLVVLVVTVIGVAVLNGGTDIAGRIDATEFHFQ